MSQGDSNYYVLSDSHSCSNDSGCGSGNFDEFTSCRRMYKRKFSTILNFVTRRSPVMGVSGGSSVTSRRSTGERPWKWRTLFQ
ncbi:hypothetical protein DPMN_099845 [Dreissena polymorpha]|uniref:Uncharacterized protein n=1 Tax=Dreissena polymorpha TaxID=45954 RepID=A0A9D4LG77_DREPO|nr:hypothetical protein DPMN_099845 [Dreissena polymorpha]